jgi:exodeoxyribonuclease-3
MNILTLNVNGLRSAVKKGLFDWLQTQNADIVCLQETKLQADTLLQDPSLTLPGYHAVYAHAEKKGYSGVAIYAKDVPLNVITQINIPTADLEGRYLQFDYPSFSIASIYFPSGTSGEHRQTIKMQFLSEIESHLKTLIENNIPCILCGDFNIAHKEIDLKNWKANQKNTGFLPEERAWMEKLFGELGFHDAFRRCHPEAPVYTWWSYRGQAYAKDVGWRIDYQVVSPSLRDRVKSAQVFRSPKFSDHAPLLIEYEI